MRFSKTTGCFYPENITYSNLPSDLIEVTPDDAAAAMARTPGSTLDVVGGRVVIIPQAAKSQAEIDAEASTVAKAALKAIDLASIRAIREYIVSHPDAPQLLKDREAAAAAQRVKVK